MARRYHTPNTSGQPNSTEVVFSIFALSGLLGLLFYTLMVPLFNAPVVSFSYSHYIATGDYRCVRVDPDTAGDCSELPLKYETHWVK